MFIFEAGSETLVQGATKCWTLFFLLFLKQFPCVGGQRDSTADSHYEYIKPLEGTAVKVCVTFHTTSGASKGFFLIAKQVLPLFYTIYYRHYESFWRFQRFLPSTCPSPTWVGIPVIENGCFRLRRRLDYAASIAAGSLQKPDMFEYSGFRVDGTISRWLIWTPM